MGYVTERTLRRNQRKNLPSTGTKIYVTFCPRREDQGERVHARLHVKSDATIGIGGIDLDVHAMPLPHGPAENRFGAGCRKPMDLLMICECFVCILLNALS